MVPTGKGRDLIQQVDLAHDQPDLGVLVVLAAVVGDPHVPLQAHGPLVGREGPGVEGPPGQAAGQVGDLHRDLAFGLAPNRPHAQVLDPRREGQVRDLDPVHLSLGRNLQAGGIDQGALPGELEAVGPLVQDQGATLPGQGQVRGVVDSQLHAIPRGQCHQVHLAHGQAGRRQEDAYRSPAPHGCDLQGSGPVYCSSACRRSGTAGPSGTLRRL